MKIYAVLKTESIAKESSNVPDVMRPYKKTNTFKTMLKTLRALFNHDQSTPGDTLPFQILVVPDPDKTHPTWIFYHFFWLGSSHHLTLHI